MDNPTPKRRTRARTSAPQELTITTTGDSKTANHNAFAALVARGMTNEEAYRTIWPSEEGDVKGKAYKLRRSLQEQITVLQREASLGVQAIHGITLEWVLGEFKQMYETPLSQIGPDSRFCRKYEVRTAMTDAGPVTTTKVEKDAPKAILEAIVQIAAIALPSQGSQAALALEERRQNQQGEHQSELREFFKRLVAPGAPFARTVEATVTPVQI